MSSTRPPFQFDLGALLARAKRLPFKTEGVSIRLPFMNISVRLDNTEQKVAREVVIRLADRRVLNAFECCDNCIDQALRSLHEIRAILVDKQVALSDHVDGPLYLLLELMLESLRQFFTFEQRITSGPDRHPQYFAALAMLRAHLYRCLAQVAILAEVEIPKISAHMRYDEAWALDSYVRPALPEPPKNGAA